MKNWQQRWFVLRGDQLFYYKDKDESKPQVRSVRPVSSGHHSGAPGGGWAWACLTASRRGEKAESVTLPSAPPPLKHQAPVHGLKIQLFLMSFSAS